MSDCVTQLRVDGEAGAQSIPRTGDDAGVLEPEYLVRACLREEPEHTAVAVMGGYGAGGGHVGQLLRRWLLADLGGGHAFSTACTRVASGIAKKTPQNPQIPPNTSTAVMIAIG